MTTPTIAANAYSALAKLHDAAGPAKGVTGSADRGSFGDMLKGAMNSLANSAKQSDTQTQARDAILTLVIVSSPLMLIGLFVGVAISVFPRK